MGHADKRKAERQRVQKEKELRMGVVAPSSMRLSEFVRDSLKRTGDQIRESTRIDYQGAMDDFITLMGNMDITFLGYSTVEEVRTATRDMLAAGAPGGRYVAACNTSPEDFIPVENYLAFVEEIHAYTPLAEVR